MRDKNFEKRKRVVVGMSGGIDSSVSALLLKREGYEVIGVQMEYWSEDICDTETIVRSPTGITDTNTEAMISQQKVPNRFQKVMENKCCSDASLLITRAICAQLDIPFYVYNVKTIFKEIIVDKYLDEYRHARTPNPCTECNKYIKFGQLLAFADNIGADFVATGHYGQVCFDKDKEEWELREGRDKHKDQSYFLYTLDQTKLARILLPLGNLTKDEIRAISNEAGFEAYRNNYKESQGLCFFSEKTPQAFLERNLQKQYRQHGNIVDIAGKILGTHTGLINFTIGQRRGLDIGGLPQACFVVELDHEKNEVVVGPRQFLYKKTVLLKEVHFQSNTPPALPLRLTARLRYHMKPTEALLELTHEGHRLSFLEPVFAVTPGQVAVFLDKDKILGGGIIVKSIEEGQIYQ